MLIARPVLVLVIDSGLVGELSAASPLGTVTVGGGSGAVSASTAHGDKRST